MSRLTTFLLAAAAITLAALALVYFVAQADESWHHSNVSPAPKVEHAEAERSFRR